MVYSNTNSENRVDTYNYSNGNDVLMNPDSIIKDTNFDVDEAINDFTTNQDIDKTGNVENINNEEDINSAENINSAESVDAVNNDDFTTTKSVNDTIPNTPEVNEENSSQFNISSLNSKTIKSKLSKVTCTVPNNANSEELRKVCYNIGTCQLLKNKKAGELNNGQCIFDNIFCNGSHCYHDDHCGHSYIKYAQPQYLRPCEKNPSLIFESCPSAGEVKCVTRECHSNDGCLSGSCVNKVCISNDSNPIHYCSNNKRDEYGQNTDIFNCRLFLYERCTKDSECQTGNCAKIKGGDTENLYCLETKVTFSNTIACVITYSVVMITLLILHMFYKRSKKTKTVQSH
ncbi:hypothetical protein LY90DRAFT_663548 [Neocallimastix californiae]|uniref:Uncharacterized protein n=1 Tax=Neocallimastix californiae TaxID=1754190 RepID=A0A1Y2FMC9_9FUNG|nr:hypothetical protein LY90DRAFT_663548 [Neocallimastix californiae]|eukprot:ORY84514.1 hypothetical protein LY90DRAFT_663548 [Neocallimastix californiae]